MKMTIALAGNPNSGKTTLFNALTGANQFVGNWPGVTVEKKEGKLKKHSDVTITDLPGIYSLSPYTMEEVVARNYLIDERPDAILNIVDGTNLERNLYLTTQLCELGTEVCIEFLVAHDQATAVDIDNHRIFPGGIVRTIHIQFAFRVLLVVSNILDAYNIVRELEVSIPLFGEPLKIFTLLFEDKFEQSSHGFLLRKMLGRIDRPIYPHPYASDWWV